MSSNCSYCLESNTCDICLEREWITHCEDCEMHICLECGHDDSICKRCDLLTKCDSCKKPNFLYFCKCGYSYCKFCYKSCANCLSDILSNSKL